MAGKTTGGGRKKPATRKKKTAAPRTRPAKAPLARGTAKSREKAADKTPVYILIIMVLLTVVIILLIGNYNKKNKKEVITKSETAESINTKDISKNENAKEKKEKIIKTIEDDKEDPAREKEKITDENIPDKKEKGEREYYIYLVKYDQKSEKMSMQPVRRSIKSSSPLGGVLSELIKGPDKNEKSRGLVTAVPDDLKIRSIRVTGGKAVLDFNDAIETNANGEILLTRIDQLVYTATQFKGVDSVIIKVNGKERKFLGGEGLSISGPIRRRGK